MTGNPNMPNNSMVGHHPGMGGMPGVNPNMGGMNPNMPGGNPNMQGRHPFTLFTFILGTFALILVKR